MKVFILPILFLGIIIASLIFQYITDINPLSIGKYFVYQLVSVIGVSVSVPPNPFNTLAQQLNEKENTLIQKEKELQEKESIIAEGKESRQNRTILYAAGGGGILLALVLLNFYLDYRRKKDDTRTYTK